MPHTIDCRNLNCPEPVLKTKNYLETEAAASVSVIVDNDAAVENVSRFLTYQGFEVGVDSDGTTSTITGTRSAEDATILETSQPGPAAGKDVAHTPKIMVMIGSDTMGSGDDELGAKLMMNFMKTLPEMGKELWRLILVNHGVKLSTGPDQMVQAIKDLENSGVDVLVCGACLTHLDLLEAKKVGTTTNMLDVITSMQLADKVINL